MSAATTTANSAADRRKQVYIGDLADDFLRIPSSSHAHPVGMQGPPMMVAQPTMIPVSSFIPANTRGRLSITVVQAKLSKNYGLVRMDPYCRVRVGNAIFDTPTHNNGAKNPIWNRTVYSYLPTGVDSIYLEIFDERAFSVDERIAWGHINLPEAVLSGETMDDWYSLSGQQGDGKEGMINLVLSLAPVEQPVSYVPMRPAYMTGYGMQQWVTPTAASNLGAAAAEADATAARGPRYTDEDVKELHEMFPQVEAEVIRSVLDEKVGNKDATINALLSITAAAESS